MKAQAKQGSKKVVLPQAKGVDITEVRGQVRYLVLNCRHLGEQRRLSSSKIEVDAEKTWIGANKRLFTSPTLTAIGRCRREARLYLERIGLPAYLKKGIYSIPAKMDKSADEHLTGIKEKMMTLVTKDLVKEWPEILATAKKKLRSNFELSDYPKSTEELIAEFGMEWEWVTLDVPVNLSKELQDKAQAKADARMEKTVAAWEQLLRAQFQEVVGHLVDTLTPSKDGKLKVFREASLKHLNEFFETFTPRNLANDVQLQALVDKAKGLSKGKTMAALKDDEHAREMVRSNFQMIKNTLATMVTVKPSREVSFDED